MFEEFFVHFVAMLLAVPIHFILLVLPSEFLIKHSLGFLFPFINKWLESSFWLSFLIFFPFLIAIDDYVVASSIILEHSGLTKLWSDESSVVVDELMNGFKQSHAMIYWASNLAAIILPILYWLFYFGLYFTQGLLSLLIFDWRFLLITAGIGYFMSDGFLIALVTVVIEPLLLT